MERRNVYQRAADSLQQRAAEAKAQADKATAIWARVAELSREDLYMLEELLRDELHGDDE